VKRYFKFDMSGRELFPLFIVFYVLFVLSYGGFFFFIGKAGRDAMPVGPCLAGISACVVVLFVTCCVFTILFSRKLVPAFSLDGYPFSFDGSAVRFLGLNVAGALLSGVTLGVYTPWYLAKVVRSYAAGVGYKGAKLEFLGRGGRLFVVLLLTLCIPVVIVAVLAITAFDTLEGRFYYQPVLQIVSYVLLTPYMYEVYRWAIHFRYAGRVIRWNTRFVEAVPRILLQTAVTIATGGIYYPAAFLVLYRYFASRTAAEPVAGPKGTFGFEGGIGRGFLLVWGQLLLTAATLGVYAPWGICKVYAWLSEKSYYSG
jgi:uncharacterized membrane protein YjgN (DUF898 family)